MGPGDVLEGYRAMSRATTVRALASGRLTAAQAQDLLDALAAPEPRDDAPGSVSAVSTPTLVRTRAELQEARDRLPGPVAVVMTMGALHEGHATLVREARSGRPPWS